MNTNVSQRRRFLDEPNYYRLLYQIARTKVNEAIRLDEANPKRNKDAAVALMIEGSKIANELRTYVVETLSKYRSKKAWFRWWRRGLEGLSPREKRIFSLLEHTVLPCTDLLIAATLHHSGKIEDAERLVEPIRQQARVRTLSYRVYYNLACYTVGRARLRLASTPPDNDSLHQAVTLLRKSFRLARDPRKGQLVEWARDDPSLEPLRSHPRFKSRFNALIASYAPPRSQHRDKNRKR